jgi:hypothetical protein
MKMLFVVTRVLFAAVLAALAWMAISTTGRADGRAWGIRMGTELRQLSNIERSQKEIVHIVTVALGRVLT